MKKILVVMTLLMSFVSSASECLLGEVKYFAFNFTPRGYMALEGQTLNIAEHTALFSLLGTTYGGDGRTTFKLPDLRGKTSVGAGNGFTVGDTGGSETFQIQSQNLPSIASSASVNTLVKTGDLWVRKGRTNGWRSVKIPMVAASSQSVNFNLNSNNVEIYKRDPHMVLKAAICTQGIYPSRQ